MDHSFAIYFRRAVGSEAWIFLVYRASVSRRLLPLALRAGLASAAPLSVGLCFLPVRGGEPLRAVGIGVRGVARLADGLALADFVVIS